MTYPIFCNSIKCSITMSLHLFCVVNTMWREILGWMESNFMHCFLPTIIIPLLFSSIELLCLLLPKSKRCTKRLSSRTAQQLKHLELEWMGWCCCWSWFPCCDPCWRWHSLLSLRNCSTNQGFERAQRSYSWRCSQNGPRCFESFGKVQQGRVIMYKYKLVTKVP